MVQSRSRLDEASPPPRTPASFLRSGYGGPRPPRPPRGPGRPRDPRSHQAILDTTVELLFEIGYARLTIEGVASRAGVGKGTIYRHWHSKGALVVEAVTNPYCAVATGRWTMHAGPMPDTGTLRDDLLALVRHVAATMSDPRAKELMPGLAVDLNQDDDLAEAVTAHLVGPQRQGVATIVSRAVVRGQARRGVDLDLLCDVLLGPICYRSYLTRMPLDDAFLTRLVDQALPGVASR